MDAFQSQVNVHLLSNQPDSAGGKAVTPNDVSHAIGSISQSYNVTGLEKPDHAWTAGFGFNDSADECDCHVITLVHVEGKNDPSNGPAE